MEEPLSTTRYYWTSFAGVLPGNVGLHGTDQLRWIDAFLGMFDRQLNYAYTVHTERLRGNVSNSNLPGIAMDLEVIKIFSFSGYLLACSLAVLA